MKKKKHPSDIKRKENKKNGGFLFKLHQGVSRSFNPGLSAPHIQKRLSLKKTFFQWSKLVLPVSARKAFIFGLGLRRGLFDSPQSLVDAAGQSVGWVWEALGVTLLLRPRTYLLQPDTLPDLSQDVVGVVVRVGGQDSQLGLPQVETAPFERGQYLVHGGARWRHNRSFNSR